MFEQVEQSGFQRAASAAGKFVALAAGFTINAVLGVALWTLIFGVALLAWNYILAPATGGEAVPMTWALNAAVVICTAIYAIGIARRLAA